MKTILFYHIDLRYLLTPFAMTVWETKGIKRKMYYVFGIRIASITL